MTNAKDLTGMRFGRLTVKSSPGMDSRRRNRLWLVECDCGATKTVRAFTLLNGSTRSCGCLHRVHGESHPPTPEYVAWCSAIRRCCSQTAKERVHYGGRGITFCREWRESYDAFLRDVGRRPSAAYSLERIDNNRGYEPGNVRWATRIEQARNMRRNVVISVGAVSLTLAEWAERTGISPGTIKARLDRGWSAERSLMTPLMPSAIRARQGRGA